MAPPLAGRRTCGSDQFFHFDLVKPPLMSSLLLVGFVFSGHCRGITKTYQMFGHVLVSIAVAGVAGYLGFRIWIWSKARALRPVPFCKSCW